MPGTQGIAALKGRPLTLLGPEIKAGQKAPDFKLPATAQHPDYDKPIEALKNVVAR